MQELQVVSVCSAEKGRAVVKFDNGMEVLLYKGEIRKLALHEGTFVTAEQYEQILREIVGIRAKKRALFLLERMDRTEKQLREKLAEHYPAVCVDEAVDYVKQYHYIDDLNYARNYIRCRQEKRSRQRLKLDLLTKGVDKSLIEQALDEEFCSDEQEKIWELLEKRHFDGADGDRREQQKVYQFLMRRGFHSSDILHVMRCFSESAE